MPARVLRWVRHSTARVGPLTSTAGLACGLITASWHHSKTHEHPKTPKRTQNLRDAGLQSCRLPAWAISMISGAVGECGGQLLLYPVETIKVLAQQSGHSAVQTLKTLFQRHSLLGALRVLFRGVGANIPITMLIGASYLGIFQISMRGISQLLPSSEQAGSLGTSATGHQDARAAVMAAVLASFAVALISGPLDMARNRKQAGLVAEPLLWYTFSARGLRETLPFMGPFMLCSVPHDLAELLIYFQLSKSAEALPEASRLRGIASQEAIDGAVGAASGAAGVLVSTPADCVKTKLITSSGWLSHGATGMSPSSQLSWLGVAGATVRRQGVSGLFVGVVPRMLDEVPGSMLHWVIAERCTRWLQNNKPPACLEGA